MLVILRIHSICNQYGYYHHIYFLSKGSFHKNFLLPFKMEVLLLLISRSSALCKKMNLQWCSKMKKKAIVRVSNNYFKYSNDMKEKSSPYSYIIWPNDQARVQINHIPMSHSSIEQQPQNGQWFRAPTCRRRTSRGWCPKHKD